MGKSFHIWSTCAASLALSMSVGYANSATITADRACTIYEHGSGSLANGAGDFVHIGNNGASGGNRIVRALFYFDVSSSVPSDAIVTSAVFRLVENTPKSRSGTVQLRRLTND